MQSSCGYDCLALTDTNLCGALDFARQANGLGLKPVTGGELTLADGSRLTLLPGRGRATATSPACSPWPTPPTG